MTKQESVELDESNRAKIISRLRDDFRQNPCWEPRYTREFFEKLDRKEVNRRRVLQEKKEFREKKAGR